MDTQQDMTDQVVWLRQIANWMIPIGGGSAVIYGAGAVLFSQPLLVLMVGTTLLVTIVSVWVRWSIGRRSVATLVLALVLALWTIIVLVGVAIPVTLPGTVAALVMTVALALPYIRSDMLPWLSLTTWLLALLMVVLARYLTIFEPLPQEVADILGFFVTLAVVAVCLLLLWQFHARLTASLVRAQTANSALMQAQAGLETQIHERTLALQHSLAEAETARTQLAEQLAVTEQQRELIREMSVPVLPISNTTLVMPLVGALDSARLAQIQAQALSRLEATRARRLLLDITGVPVIDTQVAQGLLRVAHAAKLLGSEVALIGIRPEVAQTIVGLGVDLSGIQTHSDLQGALLALGATT